MAEGQDTSGRTAGRHSAYPLFSAPALICFTGPKGVDGMVVPPDLSEGEAVGLNAGVGEGDLEGAAGDGAGLADELVHPLLCDRAVAIAVDVASVRLAGGLPVDEDAASYGGLYAAGPMTRLRSREWKQQAMRPPAAFSVVASPAMVQSPDRAH